MNDNGRLVVHGMIPHDPVSCNGETHAQCIGDEFNLQVVLRSDFEPHTAFRAAESPGGIDLNENQS
jgi:hypothetical protein